MIKPFDIFGFGENGPKGRASGCLGHVVRAVPRRAGELQKVAKKFQGEPLVILGISLDSDEKEWNKFISKNEMTWLQSREKAQWRRCLMWQRFRTPSRFMRTECYRKNISATLHRRQTKETNCHCQSPAPSSDSRRKCRDQLEETTYKATTREVAGWYGHCVQ